MRETAPAEAILSVLARTFPGRITINLWPEFGQAVGLSRTLVYEAASRGDIPTRRVGRRLIVPIDALAAWLSVAPSRTE